MLKMEKMIKMRYARNQEMVHTVKYTQIVLVHYMMGINGRIVLITLVEQNIVHLILMQDEEIEAIMQCPFVITIFMIKR